MQAEAEASRAEREAEHNAFMQRVQQRREAEAVGKPLPAPTVPTWAELGAQWQQERREAAEAAEAARIAAITPRQIWMSQLTFQQQERVRIWDKINAPLEWNMAVQP